MNWVVLGFVAFSLFFSTGLEAKGPPSWTELTPRESASLNGWLKKFYANPKDPSLMQGRVEKFDALTGTPRPAELRLKLPEGTLPAGPLENLAQAKSTEKYQKWYCENFLKRRFPTLDCEGKQSWSHTESNDTVEGLTQSWIPPNALALGLDDIPSSGVTGLALWSDDYWRVRWGGTSYRYQEQKKFGNYVTAIADYRQPLQWILVGSLAQWDWITDQTYTWSPAEKYDLAVGDPNFTLTNQQKNEGESLKNSVGDVAGWAGICHGWAPASLSVKKPMQEVVTKGPGGFPVRFTPNDIRALVSLSWANGTFQSDYAGSRCRTQHPALLASGRIDDKACFDSNPATFHLALGNLIGKQKLSFIMDNSYDYEIWNQPLYSYQFTYFNPLDTSVRSSNWRDVAVPYDFRFKSQDRFQFPMTRGIRGNFGGDAGISAVVGVAATIVYVAEVFPRAPQLADRNLIRIVLVYDLEIEDGPMGARPTGGEWHQNAHPDFLWIPKKGEFVTSETEPTFTSFSTETPPSPELTAAARKASEKAYPVCSFVSKLANLSAGGEEYKCRPPKEAAPNPGAPEPGTPGSPAPAAPAPGTIGPG